MDTKKMMTIQKFGLMLTILAAMLLIGGAAFAADTAVWTTVSVTGSITDNLTLGVDEELRFGDVTDPSLARQHTDISLGWKVNDILAATFGYRNTSDGEHRTYVGLGLRLLSGDINLDSVTKLELRDGDTLRGRTAIEAATTVVGIDPYVSNELFVDDSGLTGNRASVGVVKGIDNTFAVNAYYLLDTTLGDTTSHAHVLGLGLNVSL